MRKARYDRQQVICRNSSHIGYSGVIAKPGYWITFNVGNNREMGRVLGRVAETDRDGKDCAGHLAVIMLGSDGRFAYIVWVPPEDVTTCYEKPPHQLMAWLTGDEWIKDKDDIARIIAMSAHGTLSEEYIANRDNPDQAYNARPEYIQQFILK